MNLKNILSITGATAIIASCASTPDIAKSGLPTWITAPTVDNGFADTQCVQNSGDMSTLKNKAVALSRAEIAKQINIQLKAMDKTYQNLTDVSQGSSSGSTFESVSKQITEQTLSGTRAIKVDYVKFPDNTTKLCAMVTLSPELSTALFEDVLQSSQRQISPQHKAVLYQEFKAHKAQQELEAETLKADSGL